MKGLLSHLSFIFSLSPPPPHPPHLLEERKRLCENLDSKVTGTRLDPGSAIGVSAPTAYRLAANRAPNRCGRDFTICFASATRAAGFAQISAQISLAPPVHPSIHPIKPTFDGERVEISEAFGSLDGSDGSCRLAKCYVLFEQKMFCMSAMSPWIVLGE